MAVFKPGQSEDDCWIDGSYIYLSTGYLTFGNDGWLGCSVGCRFIDVTIPQGATILSAKVTLMARYSDSAPACNIQIKGEDDDDAATFSTRANYVGRERTTEYVNWDDIPAWTAWNDYDSPDIKNIIQEILNRTLWASGNHLVLFFAENSSSAGALRSSVPYNLGNMDIVFRLDVTWSTGPTGYTLTAEAGSYSKTGQSAGLKAARKVTATPGSYALTGQSVALRASRKLQALGDSYALTGQAVDLKVARKIPAGAGSYALTGQDAILRAMRLLAAEGGSYVLTGMDVNLAISHHYTLICEAGSYGEPYSKIFVTLDGRIYKKMGNTYLRLA